jgi:hypothetical protein
MFEHNFGMPLQLSSTCPNSLDHMGELETSVSNTVFTVTGLPVIWASKKYDFLNIFALLVSRGQRHFCANKNSNESGVS